MVRCKTDMLSGLIRKSPLAPLLPPGQAPPRLPARRGLQLGEKGSCPGGRPYGPAAKRRITISPFGKEGIRGILRIVGVVLTHQVQKKSPQSALRPWFHGVQIVLPLGC